MILKGSWYQLTKGEHKGTLNSCSVASVQEYLFFTLAQSLQDCPYLDKLRYRFTGQMLQVGVEDGSVCNTAPSVKYNTVRASIVLAAC